MFWIEKLQTYKAQVRSRARGVTPCSQNSFSFMRGDGLVEFEFKPKILAEAGTSGQTALVYDVYANEDALKQGSLKNLP